MQVTGSSGGPGCWHVLPRLLSLATGDEGQIGHAGTQLEKPVADDCSSTGQ